MRSLNLVRISGILFVLLVLTGFAACNGGSSEQPNPNGIRPSITSLSRTSANIGDTLEVRGLNFGSAQGSSRVSLNGVSFQVNNWSETQLDVTVANGMTSGIVVVTVDSLTSLSGQEAQLFIPVAPAGQPIINALTPDYGRIGEDQILISGQGFGEAQGDSQVFFTAQSTATSQAGVIEANVVTQDVNGTVTEQWTSSSIKVWVPATAANGPVYVVVGGNQSNSKEFNAMPPIDPPGDPLIDSFSPTNGPVDTLVEILGGNFGHQQGGSTLTINGLSLEIISWATDRIQAIIPEGATTGEIVVTVGSKQYVSDEFIVANAPVITGLSPSDMKIGASIRVLGEHFGYEQGAGALKIGQTTVSVSSWNNTEITVNSLPPISYTDADAVPVLVTNDDNLTSKPVNGRIVSDLDGQIVVDKEAGVQNSAPGADDGTMFVFTAEAVGGTGPYEYRLIPNISNPGEMSAVSTNGTIEYYYDAKGTFTTGCQITDSTTGDSAVITGPEILVVGPDEPVIIKMGTGDFSKLQASPNDFCYQPLGGDEIGYNDFTFTQAGQLFGSSLSVYEQGGVPLTGYTRDHASFLLDGVNTDPKPHGYRYSAGLQGTVKLEGLNFGETEGQIWLNSNGAGNGFEVASGNINSWTDTLIEFSLPANEASNLSGGVTVGISGGNSFTSKQKLICSAYVTTIDPTTNLNFTTNLLIGGFDFKPPEVSGVTGDKTYIFWVIQGAYTDPWSTQQVTRPVLIAQPFEVNVTSNSITFDMSQLAGNHLVEVFDGNNPHVSAQFVEAVAQEGDYYFFLWTGAMDEGKPMVMAESGVMSEAFPVEISSVPDVFDISGTVTDVDTPGPLAGVTITINTTPQQQAVTDATGAYSFNNIPEGTYTLTPALAPWNFTPATRNVTIGPSVNDADFDASMDVPDNVNYKVHVFIWTLTPPDGPPTGPDLPGATVNVYRMGPDFVNPEGPVLWSGDTINDGTVTFQMPSLEGETPLYRTFYYMEFSHPDHTPNNIGGTLAVPGTADNLALEMRTTYEGV